MLTISDYINLTLCIFSFVLAALSIVFVVITLKQNNKMIESSTRPYLTIYDNVTVIRSVDYFIILKNYGQSSALIHKFEYDIDLSECISHPKSILPFKHMEGTTVAPNQSFSTNIDIVKLLQKTKRITFSLEYSSPNSKKIYKENIILNIESRTDNLLTKAQPNKDELKLIANCLQEMIQKQL